MWSKKPIDEPKKKQQSDICKTFWEGSYSEHKKATMHEKVPRKANIEQKSFRGAKHCHPG